MRLETGQVFRSARGEFDQFLRVDIAVELGHRRHDARAVFGRLRTVVDDGPVGRGRGVGSGVGPAVGDREVDGRRTGVTAVDRCRGDVAVLEIARDGRVRASAAMRAPLSTAASARSTRWPSSRRSELLLVAFLLLGWEPHPAKAIDVATIAMAAPLIAVRCMELLLSTPGVGRSIACSQRQFRLTSFTWPISPTNPLPPRARDDRSRCGSPARRRIRRWPHAA